MQRRFVTFVALPLLVLGFIVPVRRCDDVLLIKPHFSYASHTGPRVFVSHHPLIAAPGGQVQIRLAPDALASGTTVVRARAFLKKEGEPEQSRDCSADGAGFRCEFAVPSGATTLVYRGSITLSDTHTIESLTSYKFRVAAIDSLSDNDLLEARVPVDATGRGFPSTFNQTSRVKTALVRDPQAYSRPDFLDDAEASVFNGILADPTYRWRDNQLAFYVFTKPAFVSSYYSGINTRCGKNPWPLETGFPAALNDFDAVGVLHRRNTSDAHPEGTNNDSHNEHTWRDCAGNMVRRPSVGSFSAATALADSPEIAKHEFGHAAFGFADEYFETTASRNVPAPSPTPATNCCCIRESSSDGGPGTTTGGPGTTTGGTTTGATTGGLTPGGPPVGGLLTRTKVCLTPTGVSETIVPPATAGSSCPPGGATFPVECAALPDAGCGGIASNCLKQGFRTGLSAAADRPNVFSSAAECDAAKATALVHPGVENPSQSLGACRQLCGPAPAQPCPCVPASVEIWITDNDPASTATPNPPDAMNHPVSAVLHGGTCERCVETSLCMRWQTSLGDAVEPAWQYCKEPTRDSVAQEGVIEGLIIAIAICLWQIFSGILF
jgi:hypothetical protein